MCHRQLKRGLDFKEVDMFDSVVSNMFILLFYRMPEKTRLKIKCGHYCFRGLDFVFNSTVTGKLHYKPLQGT